MTNRTFTLNDQKDFAAITGDCNPLHVNPVIARRLMFGRPVVHGIHALVWALDCFFADKKDQVVLNTLEVEFQGAMGVDEPISYILLGETENTANIQLNNKDVPATMIWVTWEKKVHADSQVFETEIPEQKEPVYVDPEGVAGRSEAFDIYFPKEKTSAMFAPLCKAVPSLQIAQILATTRLVGMICPGINSIFNGLTLKFNQDNDHEASTLTYKVKKYDPRFSRLAMTLEGASVKGKIKAFFRPSIKEQPGVEDLRSQVKQDEFKGQRALVLGGSRGIGEITAKLLAAGGAEVCVTYYRGDSDAKKVAENINENGGVAKFIKFNVLSPELDPFLFGEDKPFTHLYFFATPSIFTSNQGIFDLDQFDKFNAYYIHGFLKVVELMRGDDKRPLRVLYPSSVAIDELPLNMGEYSASKLAGEVLCTFLSKADPNVKIFFPRFPRIATDQTATLVQVEETDPVPLLAGHIRSLQNL